MPPTKPERFIVRTGNERDLKEFETWQPLMDPDVRFNWAGDIAYKAWRTPIEGKLTPDYVVISPVSQDGVIYIHGAAPGDIEAVVRHFEGGVESAIHAMDYVLLSAEHGKNKYEAVHSAIVNVYDLFSGDFSNITEEQFRNTQSNTRALLLANGFNPDHVLNNEEQKMERWLEKASFGHDSIGRPNFLISMGALQAAHLIAMEKRRGISEVFSKYLRMRAALMTERTLSRSVFQGVGLIMGPDSDFMNLLATATSEKTQMSLIRQLQKMLLMLDYPKVKPYRTTAIKVKQNIEPLLWQSGLTLRERLLKLNPVVEAAKKSIFQVLQDYEYLYPDKEKVSANQTG